MASLKRLGFFWGEEKITVVELEKNTPVRVVSSPLPSKVNSSSPFSSNLTEEIQVTAIFQKMLDDHRMGAGSFCVSLSMKEIILRSFIIPWFKPEELQNVIKFEAKKYVPFDVQDLSFVYHTIPFMENQTKRIQVVFFAVRKEVIARYDRIAKQVKLNDFFCEPSPVSLAKALLSKKEIKPTDHLAFLYLDKNIGYICFIDQGIPQFIRDFQINASGIEGQMKDDDESLNVKILNEVANSFDFYARQFNRDRIEQMLVSSCLDRKGLFETLAAELKVKIKNLSPLVTTLGTGQTNQMDAIYAMGACVDAPMGSLSGLNFCDDKMPKSKVQGMIDLGLTKYKEVFVTFVICLFCLGCFYAFLQSQLQNIQKQNNELMAKQGEFLTVPLENIQSQIQDNTSKLASYKSIRTKSDVASVLLKMASLLPQGAWLNNLKVIYQEDSSNETYLALDMQGAIFKDIFGDQIAAINTFVSDLKADKTLSGLIRNVSLVSLRRDKIENRDVTVFNIHCS